MNEMAQIKKFQLYLLVGMAIVSPIIAVTTYANKTEFAIEKQGIMLSKQFESHQLEAAMQKDAQDDLNFMYEKRLTTLEADDKAKFQKVDAFLVRVSEKLQLKY